MKLLLVRHGETVDNVAGIYAGSRDSPLTSHGLLQAKHLGKHLVERSSALGTLMHVFSSDLQRAFLTAQAIVDAHSSAPSSSTTIQVLRVTDLREKDFGILEGVKFGMTTTVGPGQEPETLESIRARVDRFLDLHLLPVVRASASDQVTVIVVAHGVILNDLAKALLVQFAPGNVILGGDLTLGDRHFSWRNTGYLEALVEPVEPTQEGEGDAAHISLVNLRLTIQAVNCVDHLKGVRKTGGGIGSAKFDSTQKTIDSFFKK